MKPILLFATIAIAVNVNAQCYYRETKVTAIDTIYCKPKSNRFVLNVGGQLDTHPDGTGSSQSVGVYAYARTYVWKFMFSGLVAMNPNTGYNVQEASAVWLFSGSKKAAVNTQAISATPVAWKNGGKGGEWYLLTTTSGMTSTTNWTTRRVKSMTTVNVPTHNLAGLSASLIHWGRPNNLSGNVDVTGFAFGLTAMNNTKAKYRFHYQDEENEVGRSDDGKCIVTPTGKILKKDTKKDSVNSTVDFAMEGFYAPIIIFDHPIDTAYGDIKKKHGGFRFRIEMRRKIISMRYELGVRPGIKYKIAGDAGEDNIATRALKGGYMLFGVGIGIGML